jgi:hypothetical protein
VSFNAKSPSNPTSAKMLTHRTETRRITFKLAAKSVSEPAPPLASVARASAGYRPRWPARPQKIHRTKTWMTCFSRRRGPVHFDGSALHGVSPRPDRSRKWSPFAGDCRAVKSRRRDVGCGQPDEKLAAAQGVFGHRLFEARPIERHIERLSSSALGVPPKIHRRIRRTERFLN